MSKKSFLLILSVIIFGCFIYFSYLVAKERFTQFDFDTTVKLQDRIPRKVDYPFSVLSLIGTVEITGVIFVGLGVLMLIKRYWLTFLALGLLPLALAIEVYGKVFVYHPGPPFLFYRGAIKFDFPSHFVNTDYSYPSGHVTRTAFLILFVVTWLILKGQRSLQLTLIPILAAFLAAMIVSRIYLGEHWTTDVIGGVLIGSSFGILSALTIPKVKQLLNKNSPIL